jgi:UDP-glucose 4-epimerase
VAPNINTLKNKKIVVTGGAGFIGSSLANFLAQENTVLAIDNLSSGDWSRCDDTFEKKNCDLSLVNEIELETMISGYEYLFHLAAVKLHNVTNSDSTIIQSNIVASNKLFRVAGKAGIKRVIFTSSLYANGSLGPKHMTENDHESPTTMYGASKLFSESDLRISSKLYGFSYVIPRLFFIYGPKQFASGGYRSVIVKNFEKFLNSEPMEVAGAGNQTLDYVYIDDCVQALALIANLNYEGIVQVSNGEGIRVVDLINEMAKICGNSKFKAVEPDWTENTVRVGSRDFLQSLLGDLKKTSIEEGLRKTWESMK